MKKGKGILSIVLPSLAMFILILDSKTALTGALEGIRLSIYTVIPALFPFIFLSSVLVSKAQGYPHRYSEFFHRICGIPQGAEDLLVVSFIGGYPVGASCVANACKDGLLPRKQAERLLGFCSNAGPAFIFGIGSTLFPSPLYCFAVWATHIISALFVGMVLPGKSVSIGKIRKNEKTVSQALNNSIKTVCLIGGWIVLFRIILSFLQRWILWCVPREFSMILGGLLELSSGCCELSGIPDPGIRFILFCAFLGFGGICVMMQTASVSEGLSIRYYTIGKLLHALLSANISAILAPVIFPESTVCGITVIPVFVISALFMTIYLIIRKKGVAIPERIMYNK